MGKEKELLQFSNTLKLITENMVYSTNLSQKEIFKYFKTSFRKQQEHNFKIPFFFSTLY